MDFCKSHIRNPKCLPAEQCGKISSNGCRTLYISGKPKTYFENHKLEVEIVFDIAYISILGRTIGKIQKFFSNKNKINH